MKIDQSVVPYALNSQKKRGTHSTIKVLHQPTSSECVTTFPYRLLRARLDESDSVPGSHFRQAKCAWEIGNTKLPQQARG